MKSCVLENRHLKNRFLSCDCAPEWIRDSELEHRALGYTPCPGGPSPCLSPGFGVCLGHTLAWVPCSLCFELEMTWPHAVGKCLHAYHSQRTCGFTPAAKACLLWSLQSPLPGSCTPAGLSSACHWRVQNTDPSLMAPSNVQSPQGLAWLEWDTQPVVAPGKGLQDVGQGVLDTPYTPSVREWF